MPVSRIPALATAAALASSTFLAIGPAAASPSGLWGHRPSATTTSSTSSSGTDASVDFPIAVPASSRARLEALARSTGHGAWRQSAVRALTPPASKAEAVESWAVSHGFRVVSATPWLVEVRGNAAALAADLGTTATTRTVHGKHYAVAGGALHVPAALSGVASSAVGLDERPKFRRQSSSFGGGDLQAINDLPVRGGSAGADVTVGTLNLSGWHPAVLNEFDTAFGLRPPTIQNVVVGSGHVLATAADDASGDFQEVDLDAEAISGVAPAANQRMYFGGNSSTDYLAILSQMGTDAANGLLQTASTSWGLCETQVNTPSFPNEIANENTAIMIMVAAGATFFAASGDSGSYGCGTPDPAASPSDETTSVVDWPAASPWSVAVGGTAVSGNATAGYGTPTAWSIAPSTDPSANPNFQGFGGGGGCSALETEPLGWGAPTTGCGTARAVPDIAALADPSTGFWVFDDVNAPPQIAGGTSLASPVSAASLAAFLSTQPDKHGVGDIHAAIYGHSSDFTDVITGNNGAYSAGTGYDRVTGMGAPDWRLLGADIRSLTAGPAVAESSNPMFAAPDAWNNVTVPFFYDLNGGGLSGLEFVQAAQRGSTTGCPTTGLLGDNLATANPTFTLGAGTQDGPNTVTMLGMDGGMGCRATTRTVFIDRHIPTANGVATYTGTTTPKYTLSWSMSDAAPSSGLAGFELTVVDTTTGVTRVPVMFTTSRSLALAATAGHAYALEVLAIDQAGNQSPVRVVTFRAPYDNTAAGKSSGWTIVKASPDYLGSHMLSNHIGSYYSLKFTGKTLTAGVIKSKYGGYMDVYVDNVKKARISLYAASTYYRQQIRLATFTTSGTHTVVVKVVGLHQTGSLGNYVYLDSLTVGL